MASLLEITPSRLLGTWVWLYHGVLANGLWMEMISATSTTSWLVLIALFLSPVYSSQLVEPSLGAGQPTLSMPTREGPRKRLVKCGPWTCLETCRNANLGALLQTYWIRNWGGVGGEAQGSEFSQILQGILMHSGFKITAPKQGLSLGW